MFSMKLLKLILIASLTDNDNGRVNAADVDCYKLIGVTKKDTNKKIKSAYR